jgi:hypothetical protein
LASNPFRNLLLRDQQHADQGDPVSAGLLCVLFTLVSPGIAPVSDPGGYCPVQHSLKDTLVAGFQLLSGNQGFRLPSVSCRDQMSA